MYYSVVITKCPSGFGEWQCSEKSEGYADDVDIVSAMMDAGNCYEIGVDELPDGAEDIRGRIHLQPKRVFAIEINRGIYYHGIVEDGR